MIELVVFDMAGTTLYDGNAVSDSLRAALSALGVVPELDAVNAVMGLHKPQAIRQLLTASGRSFCEQDVEAMHADFVQCMKRYYADDPAVREIAGAGAAMAELRRAGVKVALNSGFSREIVDVILARLGWAHAIDASIASDETPRGRPYPDMILKLMDRLGVKDAGRVAKVGDTPVDLAEGMSAGCKFVIGVTTGSFTREQLRVCPHTHIVESVAEVPGLLVRT